MLEKYIVDSDYQDILYRFHKYKILGKYDINNPFSVFLNEELKQDPVNNRITYLHEYTHLQLTTSTSFGHILQIINNFRLINESTYLEENVNSAIYQILNTMHDVSWNIQEGAATLYPYLIEHPFSQSLVIEKTYLNLPQRYKYAASLFAKAVGALLPYELINMGYIFINAVAQFCLNTYIMDFFQNYFNKDNIEKEPSFFLTLDLYEHLTDGVNNPNNRLLLLVNKLYHDYNDSIPTKIRDEFYDRILKFDFIKVENNRISYDANNIEYLLLVQDTLNNIILQEIDRLLPNRLSHFHSRDIVDDMRKLLNKFNIEMSKWNNISDDLQKRAGFIPSIFYF